MLTPNDIQKLTTPLAQVLGRIILMKQHLDYLYEKWAEDCIDQSIFSLEGETPINTAYNNRRNLLDQIHRDLNIYIEFVRKFLEIHSKTLIYKVCERDIQRACDDFNSRLDVVDQTN